MSEYTKEPWGRRHDSLIDDYGGWIGGMCNNDHAKRVHACVNALAGIADPEAFMQRVRTLIQGSITAEDLTDDMLFTLINAALKGGEE